MTLMWRHLNAAGQQCGICARPTLNQNVIWQNFRHWLHQKLSYSQLSVQQMTKNPSKWRFNVSTQQRVSSKRSMMSWYDHPWRRHQMETFSALLALCVGNSLVTGELQRPVTRNFDGVFFYLRLNKRLSKQSRRRWFETPSWSLWRHYNVYSPQVLQKYLAGGFCGYDKEGSPVLLELYGHLDMKGILYSAKKSDIERSKLLMGEQVMSMLEEQSKKVCGLFLDYLWIITDKLNACYILWWIVSYELRIMYSLQWRHNESNCVTNNRHYDYLLNHFFRRRSKKTFKLRVTSLCEGNPSVTGGFPSQRANDAGNISIWWRHYVTMTSRERHVVSNHQSVDCLLKSVCGPTSKKSHTPYHSPFVSDGVSNHQRLDCLLNRLFKRSQKGTSKLALCEGSSPVADKFPAQRASHTQKASIEWRHRGDMRFGLLRYDIMLFTLIYGNS